jgi:hypothetical protein
MASEDIGGNPEQPQQTEKIAQEAIDEARMVLPGIQALFGFQLIAIFNQKFETLSDFDQRLHFLALLFISLSIALIMTPAAYHRQVEPGTVSKFFVSLASVLVAVAMVPLMMGLCLEVYLVGHIILHDMRSSAIIAIVLFVIFVALWYGFPFVMSSRVRQKQ